MTNKTTDQHCWLDAHIIQQANYYNLSPKQKDELFNGAAEYAELIEYGVVTEPIKGCLND
jgi:hypothetical protein